MHTSVAGIALGHVKSETCLFHFFFVKVIICKFFHFVFVHHVYLNTVVNVLSGICVQRFKALNKTNPN